MRYHVEAPEYGHGFRITDMENAGKRGKVCRVIGFSGWRPTVGTSDAASDAARAFNLCCEMIRFAQSVSQEAAFEDIHAAARSLVDAAGLPEHHGRLYVEEVRGIDAPRPRLTAGVEGKWSASADHRLVSVDDHVDRYNEPCVITRHTQKPSAAYAIAAKVWDRVKACGTFSQAVDVLRSAGWHGHYYCRVD